MHNAKVGFTLCHQLLKLGRRAFVKFNTHIGMFFLVEGENVRQQHRTAPGGNTDAYDTLFPVLQFLQKLGQTFSNAAVGLKKQK
jgi:hypothetical protein